MGVGALRQRKGTGGPGGVPDRGRRGGRGPRTYLSPATGAARRRDVPVPDSGEGLRVREDRNPTLAAGPSYPPGRRKKLQLSLKRGRSWTLKGAAQRSGLLGRGPRLAKGSSKSQSLKALEGCRPRLAKGA